MRRGLRGENFFRAFVARAVLALALVCALLNGIAPHASLSSASLCSMPCCAGKPAHLAGSCAGGACHARPFMKKQAEPEQHCEGHHGPASHEGMQHDGHTVEHVEEHADKHRAGTASATTQAVGGEAVEAASGSFSRPCGPDCGACAGGFAQLRRTRDAALLSHGAQARPPTPVKFQPRSQETTFRSTLLRGQCAPRAPPLALS